VRRRAASLALAALSLTATACGDRVDRKQLESAIADYVKKQTGAVIQPDCPGGVKAKTGTRVHCTAVLSGAMTDIYIVFTKDTKFRIAAMRPRIR
jgi:hypothetical protein